jgi:hypothetical protein
MNEIMDMGSSPTEENVDRDSSSSTAPSIISAKKRFDVSATYNYLVAHKPVNIVGKKINTIGLVELPPYFDRDAYEHYLMIHEFMYAGSRSWSFAIVAYLFLAVLFIMLFMFGALVSGQRLPIIDWFHYSMFVSIRVFILTIYPITLIARTNAYIYALHEQFLISAPDDFEVIGGRDIWLNYVQKVPALWNVYGLTVTWDRIAGLLWTIGAGFSALILTIITAQATG